MTPEKSQGGRRAQQVTVTRPFGDHAPPCLTPALERSAPAVRHPATRLHRPSTRQLRTQNNRNASSGFLHSQLTFVVTQPARPQPPTCVKGERPEHCHRRLTPSLFGRSRRSSVSHFLSASVTASRTPPSALIKNTPNKQKTKQNKQTNKKSDKRKRKKKKKSYKKERRHVIAASACGVFVYLIWLLSVGCTSAVTNGEYANGE